MHSEKFALKWNDFHSKMSKSFNDLRNEQDFFDITLISDDESKLSAHKVVLSACSSFFKSVLRATGKSIPIIYLSGVNSHNLKFILDYMYQGEVQIFQEQLDDFLNVAQKLKIEGLISDQNIEEEKVPVEPVSVPQIKPHNENNILNIENSAENTLTLAAKTEPNSYDLSVSNFSGSLIVQDINELDKTVEELIDDDEGVLKCKVCGKVSTAKANMRQNMRKHVEIHIEGLSFDCQICSKSFRSRENLRYHIMRQHKSNI